MKTTLRTQTFVQFAQGDLHKLDPWLVPATMAQVRLNQEQTAKSSEDHESQEHMNQQLQRELLAR